MSPTIHPKGPEAIMNSDHHPTQQFDLLAELAKFGFEQSISLNDPQAIPKFATFVGESLGNALSNSALLHGHRVEAMFEALLVSLGQYALLKGEDNGRVYPSDRYTAPDFRVVLPDGNQWLIEVKNARIKEPFKQERRFMKKAYRQKLENYAAATGGDLKLAVYWSSWELWTLVSPDHFVDENGNVTIDMRSALFHNELGSLGDRFIGTKPPLKFRLEAARDTKNPVNPDGTVMFTPGRVALYSGQDELTDHFERKIAWAFMLYGDWTVTEPIPIVDDNMLTAVEFQWFPDEDDNAASPMVGTFSRIFSRYYSQNTMENENIAQLHASPQTDWFAPLLAGGYQGSALPLWLLKSQPNHLSDVVR